MALSYHNEQILSSLRSAYSRKHCDDSLLLNEADDLIRRRETGDIESNIVNLSLRLHLDSNYDTSTTKSQSSNSLNTHTIGGEGGSSSTTSSSGAQLNEGDKTYTQSLQESPTEGPSRNISSSHVPSANGPVANWSTFESAPVEHSESIPHLEQGSSTSSSVLTREHDITVSGDPAANLLQISHSFAQVKDFGLDIEDDSDFEDNILRATQEIKYQLNPPPTRRSSSIRTQSGRLPSPLKPHGSPGLPDLFTKREIFPADALSPSQSPPSSRLTSQLTTTQRDPREQYMEATAGLQTSGVTGVEFKIHMSNHEPVVITVKQDCTTHLAIGYALFKADLEQGDANLYNLRLAEDDGEPDEDFPALDRTRPLVSYHVDEFAIVKATESEFKENSKRTPNKISFKSAGSGPGPGPGSVSNGRSIVGRNASAAASTSTLLPFLIPTSPPRPINVTDEPNHKEGRVINSSSNQNLRDQLTRSETAKDPQSATGAIARGLPDPGPAGQGPGTHVAGLHVSGGPQTGGIVDSSYSSSLSGPNYEPVAVRIYMHPYDSILSQVFWTDEMVPRQSQLKEVFNQMCRDKMMDSDMYVLRTADSSHRIINMDTMLSALIPPPAVPIQTSSLPAESTAPAAVGPSSVDFEVIARRNLPAFQVSRQRSSSQTGMGDNNHSNNSSTSPGDNKAKRKPSHSILQNSVLAMQPLGFYKYPVLRRQQMNFLGRSERELVIDGEYIHIMPPTDWSLLDQPKTTTFHVRQVTRVKQSRKISTNFSITVSKPSGPKRYDLESSDTATTVEIVDRLQRLKIARTKPNGV